MLFKAHCRKSFFLAEHWKNRDSLFFQRKAEPVKIGVEKSSESIMADIGAAKVLPTFEFIHMSHY